MSKPDGDDSAPRDTPGDDDTAALPQPAPEAGPSGTAVLPPVPTPPRENAAPWSGRAAVPPPRLEEDGEGWVEPPRSRLFPVFVTAVVVLLIGVLAVAVGLALRDRSAPLAPEPGRTSVAVTTHPSRPSPTSVAPTMVVVPPLLGLDYDDAAAQLTALGLVPRREDVFHEWPVGIVTGSDPAETTQVAPGSTVTLFVSKGPEPSPSVSAPSPEPSPTASAS
jgi:hypothetical protein